MDKILAVSSPSELDPTPNVLLASECIEVIHDVINYEKEFDYKLYTAVAQAVGLCSLKQFDPVLFVATASVVPKELHTWHKTRHYPTFWDQRIHDLNWALVEETDELIKELLKESGSSVLTVQQIPRLKNSRNG